MEEAGDKTLLVRLIAAIVEERTAYRMIPSELEIMCKMFHQSLQSLLESLVDESEAPAAPPASDAAPIPACLIRFGTWLDVLKHVEDGPLVFFKDPNFQVITERQCSRSITDPTRVVVHHSVKYGIVGLTVGKEALNSFYRKEKGK